MIYSKKDIVLAFGLAHTLEKRIRIFCTLWKKYCNGLEGITIPSHRFLIKIDGFYESEDVLKITLINSEFVTHSHKVWDHTDVDLGDVVESYLVYDHAEIWKGTYFSVPTSWLLEQEDLEARLIQLATDDKAKKAEAARLAEIKRLEEALAKLKK
jgi:hypothetical protein